MSGEALIVELLDQYGSATVGVVCLVLVGRAAARTIAERWAFVETRLAALGAQVNRIDRGLDAIAERRENEAEEVASPVDYRSPPPRLMRSEAPTNEDERAGFAVGVAWNPGARSLFLLLGRSSIRLGVRGGADL